MLLDAALDNKTELLNAAIDASERAGKFLMSRLGFRRNPAFSDKHDIKVEEDFRAEEIIRLCLSDVSEYGFIGEETYNGASEEVYTWVVDPLDGSANYARGFPHFATSIALLEKGIPILGVVKNHGTGELMTAMAAEGAACNGTSMHVSDTCSLAASILAGGFMKTDEMVRKNLEFMNRAVPSTFKLRVTGSAALDICDVAMGRFDIYCEKGIRIWDVAAGLLIAKEAGASISVSIAGDAALDVATVAPGIEREFAKTFPHTAPFSKRVPKIIWREGF